MRNALLASAMSAGVALALASGDSLSGAKGPAKTDGAAGGEREPVTARGAALLAMLSEAGDAGLMLTQEEGLDAVNAGHAVVDPAVTEGNTAKVTLTDAGKAALGATGGTATGFQIEDGIAMPTSTTRRGRQGGYPFENLNVGQSFHVPLGKEDKEPADVAARLQSSVSGARARFSEDIPGETVEVTVKTYAKGPDGKFLKDADGKRVVESSKTETRPKTRLTRDFKVMPVGDTDPRGPGARVWRIELSPAGTPAAPAS